MRAVCDRSRVVILPYVPTEEGWSCTDTFMRAVFAQMQLEGTLQWVFRGERVTDAERFISVLRREHNSVAFAFYEGELAMLSWLNGMGDDHAQGHFWFSRKFWGDISVGVAKCMLRHWFSFVNLRGEPLFKAIFGMLAGDNRRAIRFARKIGWVELGFVPQVGGPEGTAIGYVESTHGQE